jgi:branched-chain amino acid transport system substrate-binding protein
MKKSLILAFTLSILLTVVVIVGGSSVLAEETIRIGGMDMMTGTMADYGWMMKVGGELAVEHLNEAGGLLGKKVEMKFMDSEWNPQTGVKNAEFLARDYGAKLIYGFSSDVVPEAIIPHLERLDCLLIHSHSAVQSLTEEMVFVKGYKYYFRNCVSVVQDGNLPAAFFSKWPDIKTYASVDAWEYGNDATRFFGEFMKKVRPDVKQVADVDFEFGHVAFGPELSAVAAKKPNLIISTAPGGMATALIRQALIMGLFEQDWLKAFFIGMGNHTGVAKAIYNDLKSEKFKGKMWGSARYIWNANDRPANVKFWKAFLDKYKRYPSYPAALGYTSIMIWADCVKKAGSTDPKTLIPVLEGYTSNDLPIGEPGDDPVFLMRAEDHQGCYTTPLGRYVYDPALPVEKIGVLKDFSNIPWQEYYRHPPDFKNPPHDKAYVKKWYNIPKK